MALNTVILDCEDGGERIDVFLAANIGGLTRSAAQKLLEGGGVMLHGKAVRKNHRTAPGDTYTVTQDPPEEPVAVPQDIPLDIIYEDADVIVVNKPRGMVVHPAPGHPDGTLVNALLNHCAGSLSGIGGVKRPGIVHRIDKDTSGLVIAAKNDRAHIALAGQFAAKTLAREYDAVVHGVIKADSGTVDAPIGRHPEDRKKQYAYDARYAHSERHGRRMGATRPAVTHYQVVARYTGFTHIRCRLETGRTHQIRVHMAHIGHPILGDTLYGKKKPELGLTGQCLHASKLRFLHPTTYKPMEFTTDLPGYFKDVLARLRP